jgi:hypothetical protein
MGPISATIRFPAYPPCAGLGRRDLKSGTRGTGRARTTGMRERACQPRRDSPNSPLAGTARVHDGYPQRSPRLRRGDGIRRPDGASGHAEARCIAFARLSWGFDSPRLHSRAGLDLKRRFIDDVDGCVDRRYPESQSGLDPRSTFQSPAPRTPGSLFWESVRRRHERRRTLPPLPLDRKNHEQRQQERRQSWIGHPHLLSRAAPRGIPAGAGSSDDSGGDVAFGSLAVSVRASVPTLYSLRM